MIWLQKLGSRPILNYSTWLGAIEKEGVWKWDYWLEPFTFNRWTERPTRWQTRTGLFALFGGTQGKPLRS